MATVEHLPLPYWLTYLLVAVLESLLVQAAAWIDGTTPFWTLQPIFLLFPLRTWMSLALMQCLNHQAIQALHSFRPLLNSDEDEIRLREWLTTLPARPVWIVQLIGALYFLMLVLYSPIDAFKGRPLLTPAYVISGFIAFAVGSIIYYHTFHQLRLVHRIYANVRSFNLFQLQPVYAFSRLTALTGVVYLLLISLTLILFPYPLTDTRAVVSFLLQILLSILAFVLPLWNTHQRLTAEKNRLQSEVERRIESILQKIHHHLDEFDLQTLTGPKTALESLLLERKVLEEIPTWPWQPSTLRSLLSALFLPLLLFLAQLVLERWITL
jgi:hypothetical protein